MSRLLARPLLGRRLRVAAASVGGATAAGALYLRGADDEYRAISEQQLPHEYDPQAFAAFWSQHPRCCLSRVVTIARRATPLAATLARDWLLPPAGETSEARDERYATRAREMRSCLTDLGPTFIKFGQALSIRPDVLPPPAVYELQKLCDSVPSYPTRDALRLIEEESGRPASELFDGLDEHTEPIAAASLGQVYRCRLRAGGREVALKVQRPDMIRAVSLDLFLLRRYMHFVEWFKINVLTGMLGAADRAPFDVHLLDTFARASYLELDYRREAQNLDRFASELIPRLGGKVYVPESHWEVTTRKMIATEWIEGEQLAKSPPAVINRLIPIGVACFLAQLLDVGFFHADPHPGNMLVDAQGRLVLIDFGLCAEIASFDTRHLTSAIVSLMRGDVDGLVEDAVTLRFLPADVDRAALLPPLRAVFAQGKLAAATFQASRKEGRGKEPQRARDGAGDAPSGGEYGAVAAKRAQFAAISKELNQIFFDFPFAVPEYFALITRALIVLEGIALTGDKDFDLWRAAYPLAAAHAARLFGKRELASMLGEARAAQRSLYELAAEGAEQEVARPPMRRGIQRTLSLKAWI